MVGEMRDEAVEAIGDRRARRAACGVIRAEHEMVDEELRAPSEQLWQRRAALLGIEAVLFVDTDPRQLLSPARELIATPRQLLLGFQQLEPGGKPLFTRSGCMFRHRFSPIGHRFSGAPL